jgi:polar amino acid transport system substrate-binding protein
MKILAATALAATLVVAMLTSSAAGTGSGAITGLSGAPPAPPPAAPSDKKVLVVGTHEIAPFVIKAADGSWSGISIDLVRRIASDLGMQVEVRELTIEHLVAADDPTIDVTASVNVTVKSNGKFELSHAFYSTGLAIAVPATAKKSFLQTLGRIFSGTFVLVLVGILVGLAAVGFLMFRLEKHATEPTGEKKELSKALFWAFEPVIGYKASQHKSRGGRILGTVWGLFGLVFVTGVTANLSSRLTVDQLATTIKGPEDLVRLRVGTVDNSSALKFCERRGLAYQTFADSDAAMKSLATGEVDAVVYEAPVLAYAVATKYKNLRVISGTFANHGYAFGLRPNSPLRVDFNRALLTIAASDEFTASLARYLGRGE